jgi:hypothetical protein
MSRELITLHTCFWLLAILVLVRCWSSYRVDALRHKLFLLRDELFEICKSGELPFDEPANRALRGMIDSTIRFAHKFTWTRFALLIGGQHFHPALRIKSSDWESMVDGLPDAAKDKLIKIRQRMHTLLTWHLISGSPVTMAMFIAVLAFLVAKHGTLAMLHGYAERALRKFSDSPPVELAFETFEDKSTRGKAAESSFAYGV